MKYLSLVASSLFLAVSTFAQDHGHLNVGAVNTNQNGQLIFDNADAFSTTNGYIKTFLYATTGKYAGRYEGNITLTALAGTPAHLGPVPNAPALGSDIYVQFVSVDGPTDGVFSFWESNSIAPTYSLTSGTTGTNLWRLTESDASPGSDPFGHAHGRRFTATKPGIYTVGFRAYDLSTNGVGSGPIHTPSTVFKVYFQAGDNIHSVTMNTLPLVRFAARAGISWQVQSKNSFSDVDWTNVGTEITGDDYLHTLVDDSPTSPNRIYRLQGTPIIP